MSHEEYTIIRFSARHLTARSVFKPSRASTSAVVLAMLVVIICCIPGGAVQAQDRPFAFASDAELSAANKSEFQRIAGLYKNETDAGRRKTNRNKLISLTIAQDDLNFLAFQKKSRNRKAIWGTLLDILEIGAATAITLTNGERARTVISEGLGFLQLSRQALDKNFALKERQILFNKMIAKRAEIQTNILRKTSSLEDDQYDYQSALIDLVAYHRAGTIDGALDHLNVDTGAEAQQALEVLENVKLSPPATKEEADLAKGASDELFDLKDDLADAQKRAAATTTLVAITKELEKDSDLVTFLTAAGVSSQETDGDKLRLGIINVRRALRSADPPKFDLLNKVNRAIINATGN